MTDYNFRALSPVDFEQFARDLLNADLGLRLHSYAAGQDQGIDLRQQDADGRVIVAQCKHYPDSDASTFLRAVEKEGKRGQGLVVDRYLFVTSRRLTPIQQDKILAKLARQPLAKDDIWGQAALNAALARHPEVERRHIKLWISSAEVLDALLRNGQWQRSEALLAELSERTRRWAQTPAYDQVLDMLEREGVCIICGPPGVGKSFLAEMALLAAANDGWQVVDVADNIEDAWNGLRHDDRRQIFYYDDFLGSAGLELTSKSEPRNLNRFLARMRQLKDTKRIILTTRTQILHQAATGPVDQLSDLARQPARFSLELDAYNLDTRARILFNQLYFAQLPPEERKRLALDSRLITIAEHPSYSPRLIEGGIRLAPAQTADDLVSTIRRALDKPEEVWHGSFRGLTGLAQQILLTLATLPHRPWPVDVIRDLVAPRDAIAWMPALRALETTWLQLTGIAQARTLGFANSSCRDYLLGVLDDTAVAIEQLERATLLTQLVTLGRTAGLIPPLYRPGSAVARAELASVLASRRSQTLAKTRQITEADLNAAPDQISRVRTLTDSAALLTAVGRADDTAWLLDHLDNLLVPDAQNPAPLPVTASLALAETVSSLPAADPGQRTNLAHALALAATGGIGTLGDLDAYEALPDELTSQPTLQALARERALPLLEAQRDYLTCATGDAETVEADARDLEQRAQRHSIELDIALVLDHADDLAHEQSRRPDSPTPTGQPDNSPEEPETDLHQIFAQFAVPDTAE